MLTFKEIHQRILKQLPKNISNLVISPFIKKSAPLQPIYIITSCPPLSPSMFKTVLDEINKVGLKQPSLELLSNIFKKAEQYFTSCIEILEHNQQVRQKYEILIEEQIKERQQDMKQLKEIIRTAQLINSNTELKQFGSKYGTEIIGDKLLSKGSQNKQTNSASKVQAQLKQLYLPAHPDQYSLISSIQSDQYFALHQQILQSLFAQLSTLNKLNSLTKYTQTIQDKSINQIKYILVKLSVNQLFRLQDNKYNQLIKFLLVNVYQTSEKINRKKTQTQNYATELKRGFMKACYLGFLVKNQLQQIKNRLVAVAQQSKKYFVALQNKEPLPQGQVNSGKLEYQSLLSKVKQQLIDMSEYSKQTKSITDFLCDKQQKIFHRYYDRKIKKTIVLVHEVNDIISIVQKIDHKLISKFERTNYQKLEGATHLSLQRKTQIKSNIQQTLERFQEEVQNFFSTFNSLKQQIRIFIQQIYSMKSPQIYQNAFKRFFRELQQTQLKYSELKRQQLQLKSLSPCEGDKLNQDLKKKILNLQSQLIEGIQKKSESDKVQLFANDSVGSIPHPLSVHEDQQISIQLSRISRASRASSNKSTVFMPYTINQIEVILPSPTLENSSIAPALDIKTLIFQTNQFINNQFINNHNLTDQLQDASHLNFQQLLNLTQQLSNALDTLNKQNIQLAENQTSLKNKQNVSQKQKNKIKKLSPQKSQQKTKSKTKSPKKLKKPSAQDSPLKQDQKRQQISALDEQTVKDKHLKQLHSKLRLIRQILVPEISQRYWHLMFEQSMQLQIYKKVILRLKNYKEKIFTEQIYHEAAHYGFSPFLQERVKFLDTVIKNLMMLQKIFQSILFLSQRKVSFDAVQDQTYQIMLKTLLAQKELQAYRRENQDLAKTNQISVAAVKALQNQIYKPFSTMFKKLMKIASNSDDDVSKELQIILESVKAAIELKQTIASTVQKIKTQSSLTVFQIEEKIKSILREFQFLKRYPILKYKQLEAIIKTLRTALSMQKRSKKQNQKQAIQLYLKQNFKFGESDPDNFLKLLY